MTFATERRASTRHSTAHNQTNVQLMDRLGRRITKARLVNISHHGALILTDDLAVLHQPLDVQFENAPETRWIAAEPVRFGQLNEVGIHFNRPCSRRILNAAISGAVNERLGEREAETPFFVEPESARSGPITPSRP